jgi:hypothetical protein
MVKRISAAVIAALALALLVTRPLKKNYASLVADKRRRLRRQPLHLRLSSTSARRGPGCWSSTI